MEGESSSEARLRHQLDVQSKQINRVLSHHRIPATVAGGSVRPRVISFDLQTQLASGLERARNLKDDLMTALGVSNVSLTNENGRWQLRVSQADEAPVPLLKLLAAVPDLPRLTAPIGVANGGAPVLLRFAAGHTSHILIAGEPGAGKTSLLRAIAAGLALTNRQSGLQIQIMDPAYPASANSNHALLPLAYLPHMLSDPALDIEACSAVIRFLAEEMTYRRRERVQVPRIVVLIDHVLAYLENVDHEARNDLFRLLQYGAPAGIHSVMATDRPESPLLDSTIRASLSARLIGRTSDATAARRIAGVPLDQATLLYGEGDFLAVNGEDVTYFQAAHIGDYDLHMKLTEMVELPRPRLLARTYSERPSVGQTPPKPRSFTLHDGGIDIREDGDDIIPIDSQ